MPEHEDLGRLLKRASAQMSRHFNAFARSYHLTAVQMSLIDFLCLHKQQIILQKDVEHEFVIRRSTASVLLSRMERHRLLIRVPNPDDSRQRQIKLTGKSLKMERLIISYMRRQQKLMQQNFSTSQLRLLRNMLKRIVRLNQ